MQSNLFGETESDYIPADVIILSLQPYAFDLIRSGTKKMEYRRRFRKRPTIGVIYVSTPTKEIRGFMLMAAPIIDTPKRIGEIAESLIPGNGQAVYDYLKDQKQGYAIPIKQYTDITPISLERLRTEFEFEAPQSYVLGNTYPKLLNYLITEINKFDIRLLGWAFWTLGKSQLESLFYLCSMSALADIRAILKGNKDRLCKKYGINSIAIFGSYSRGQQNLDSDLDIMVDFKQPVGVEFIDLAEELESLLKVKIDLVSKNGIKKAYWQQIEGDLNYV